MQFKLFVSANQKELREERFAIKEVINDNATLRQVFDVFLFEDQTAKRKSPSATYLKHVSNSDIYVGILGKNYGDKGPDGLSATEREFRRFLKANPDGEVIVLLQGESFDDDKRDKDLQELVRTVKANHIYKRFRNIDELKTQVLNSLISFLDEKGGVAKGPFDSRICPEIGYDAIDEQAVKDFLQNRAIKRKSKVPDGTAKDFLTNVLKVVKKDKAGLQVTNAGLLFFGKEPSEIITHHEIRIARYKGTDRVLTIDSQEIKGPIYKMLDEVQIFLRRATNLASKIVEFERIDIPEYPYEAIREAVINAIAHRDYNRRGTPIMVAVFDDRVEVKNPGGLLPGLKIKSLEGKHSTRNEMICRIFHETMDMERFGTGIGKMKNLMKAHGLKEPTFAEEGDFFAVTFYGPGDKILDLVPSIPKERTMNLQKLGLNERQIEALRLMVNEKKTFDVGIYCREFKVNEKTARRDFKKMISVSVVEKIGSTKGSFFKAKI